MLSKQDKTRLRGTIFRHLDGIATVPTAFVLHDSGVLHYLLKHEEASLSELTKRFGANEGYLNVALRVVSSQGWLTQHLDNHKNTVSYSVNEHSKEAFGLVLLYQEAFNLLNYSVKFPQQRIGPDAFNALEKIFAKFKDQFGLKQVEESPIKQQVLKHIEGAIAGPI